MSDILLDKINSALAQRQSSAPATAAPASDGDLEARIAAAIARRTQSGAQQPPALENAPTAPLVPVNPAAPDTQGDLGAYQGEAARQHEARVDNANGTLAGAFAHGVTFGFADELRAGVRAGLGMGKGDTYGERFNNELSDARAMLEKANKDHPIAAPVAEIGGAIAPMLLTGGSSGLLSGASLGTRAATTGGRIALGAVEGAGTGALYGYGTGEGGVANRVDNALWQGGIGGLVGGSVAGVMNRLATRSASRTIPTTAELRAAKTAAYRDAVDGSGVILRPDATNRIYNDAVAVLTRDGYSPRRHPLVRDFLEELNQAGQQNITPHTLQNYMDAAREISKDTLPNNAGPSKQGALGTQLVNIMRDYMETTPASDVLMGNSARMNRGFIEGSQFNSRFRRSQQVDDVFFKAENRAASTYSGGNADNATRQNFRPFLENQKYRRGMTEAETAAATDIVRGNPARNFARSVGNRLSPVHGPFNGLGYTVGLSGSGALGSPTAFGVGVGLAGVGIGAKALANRGTQRAAQRLSEVIRSGGQTAEQIVAQARRGAPVDPRLLRRIGALDAIQKRATPASVIEAGRVQNWLAQPSPEEGRQPRYR